MAPMSGLCRSCGLRRAPPAGITDARVVSAQPNEARPASIDTARPFTRRQALGAGITLSELRGRAYQRLHTGIFISATVAVTPVIRAAAALLPYDDSAFASHATAARVWGLPVPALPDEHVTVVEKTHRRRRSDIVCHYAPNGWIRTVDGVRVSAAEQTFVELATLLPLVELVVVGDHLVRHRMISLTGLRRFCDRAATPGAARARLAAGYVRERVDSPMESRVRMLIVLAGLPEPQVNITVGDDEGIERRKYDLSWPEVKLIVEYDGRHHIERVEQWESDRKRREAIEDDGWRIIVLVANDIYATPAATIDKLHRLLAERRHPGVPTRLSLNWHRHFPGRE